MQDTQYFVVSIECVQFLDIVKNHTIMRINSYFHFKLSTIITFEITVIQWHFCFGCICLNIKHIKLQRLKNV